MYQHNHMDFRIGTTHFARLHKNWTLAVVTVISGFDT